MSFFMFYSARQHVLSSPTRSAHTHTHSLSLSTGFICYSPLVSPDLLNPLPILLYSSSQRDTVCTSTYVPVTVKPEHITTGTARAQLLYSTLLPYASYTHMFMSITAIKTAQHPSVYTIVKASALFRYSKIAESRN